MCILRVYARNAICRDRVVSNSRGLTNEHIISITGLREILSLTCPSRIAPQIRVYARNAICRDRVVSNSRGLTNEHIISITGLREILSLTCPSRIAPQIHR